MPRKIKINCKVFLTSSSTVLTQLSQKSLHHPNKKVKLNYNSFVVTVLRCHFVINDSKVVCIDDIKKMTLTRIWKDLVRY